MTKPNVPTEELEQVRFVVWLESQKIAHFAIPNGGHRHVLEGMKLKRSGVKSGVPDLFIPMASGGYHGLFIEMKRTIGGKVSDNQLYWLSLLRENGYYADIANGCDEAKRIVLTYLALTPKAA
jgi:hypothetical protein